MKNQLTIFYTDDDQEDLEFFIEASSDIGNHLNVVTQNCGKKLLYDLENPPPNPHIVFLDLNMPGFSGFDVLQQLKSSGNFKDIPIVIFSTSNDIQIIEKSRALGASYYISKPTDYNLLKKTIEHAVNIDWNTFKPTSKEFVYINN
ncbi:response regulator [Flavobacterium agrisoli]|uniref:Response regulator n=1 Tax=Flavobacterium agrisoli TaxID=2793066 RepID=A0A934PJT0_9FLAO|nr:response regulator [Flavobacterium agrisoli]MBK0368902.1 response regulator [Flavobacterium agrisoli]